MKGKWLPILLLATAACSEAPPSGQVVARVNGTDVTRRDVLVELGDGASASDVDIRSIQPALLDGIIARKLLADEATRREIDRSPEFIGKYRRYREELLADLYRQRLAEDVPPPSAASIDTYLADNKARFADRHILLIDRIATLAPLSPDMMRGAGTIDTLAERLHARRVPFTRTVVTIDSLDLTAAAQAELEARRGIMTTRQGKGWLIDQLITASPAPLSSQEARPVAATHLRTNAVKQAVEDASQKLRTKANLEISADFKR